MTHEEFIDQYLQDETWHIKDGILYVDDNVNLHLPSTNISSLPEGLHINGWLDLEGSDIVSLPERLHVDGWLDLDNTKIKYLPGQLFIGDYLDLEGSMITALPEGVTASRIYSFTKLSMTEKTQIRIIQQYKSHFKIIENPTKKAITMHKLLWEI